MIWVDCLHPWRFGFRMAQEKERKEKAAATPPRRRPGEEAGVKVFRWKGSR